MKINVTENKVSIKEEQILNENEYNIHKIQFDFSSEYTDDLVKVALFSIDNHTYKKIISNNECDIPPEVLTQRGYSILGVYAYKAEQDTLVLRYSPSPTKISVYDGSYKADAENSEPITPSEIEQYQQILQNSLQQFQNQYNALVEETEGDIQAIEDELQRKVDEGYFDGEDGFSPIAKVIQKSNGATIEIEDKNGKTTADVLNGADGKDGENGQDGQDGYTPQRGIDYWTEEDKEEIKEETIAEIDDKIEEYNTNAAQKVQQYNSNATQKTTDYNTNASQKLETYNQNHTTKLGQYNTNATEKTNTFDTNATNKLTEYNTNHTEKMSTYNNNSTEKLNAFNENAVQKTEDFDAHTEKIQDNIEALQTENERLKATLPTTGEVTGQAVTLNKTAELEFKKPPLPMGNSEQEGEPSPENEVPITNVTGDVEVKVQNKNLFDKNNVINGYLNADGTTTSNNTFRVSDYINIKGLDNITISGNYGGSEFCCFYDKNKEFISYFGMGSLTTRVASVPTNAEYVRVTVRQDVINKYQLEQGPTATPYTSHKEQIFIFPLGNIELCKIGDYQDYFYKESNKWYLHKEIGKVVLDGSQTINKNSSDTSNYLYYINLSDHLTGGNVISNKLTIKSLGQLNGDNSINNVGISILNSNKIIYFNIGYYLSTNTVAGVSAYLTENNITIYYVLETPTDTEITDTTLISQLEAINNALSYEEQTNISSNTIALFNVEAYQDIKEKIEEAGGHTHNNKAVLDGISSADITRWNNKSDFSGDYNDLSNKPTIPDVSGFITKDVNNLTNYTLKTNTGSLIDLEINNTTYVVTMKLKDVDGNVISTDTIDLPLETVVVSGRYDNTTKKVILTLENGSEVDFSVADLVAGLQTEITSSNKLASDLVDDTNSGNKFVTTSEKQTWNGKYDKPSTGIPKTDLASAVQTSLGKADTALQSHQDISGKANKISVVQTSTSTIEINPNTFYKFGEVASLNITLASITDNTIYNEYMFEFVSGTTATTLTLPSSIKWLETPTIDANKIYQCSIVDNVGLLVGVANV